MDAEEPGVLHGRLIRLWCKHGRRRILICLRAAQEGARLGDTFLSAVNLLVCGRQSRDPTSILRTIFEELKTDISAGERHECHDLE